jgi:hypothetical protein
MHQPKYIYLDTMIWNTLCDEAVDPRRLEVSLATKNAGIALGLHNFYEFTKVFGNRTNEASERGERLLSYLKEALDAGIVCVKENDELLAAEMWALQLKGSSVDPFYSNKDRLLICDGVGRLAKGGFDERTAKYIRDQKEFAATIRQTQKERLEGRPSAKQYLKTVTPNKLEQWLDVETCSATGRDNLKDHIRRRFPEATEIEAMEYVSALLASPICRAARGLVRASTYYMWRCAYRDSVPSDLSDDMYHVLNSIHCDVYATQEARQTEYARLILTSNTVVSLYVGQGRIDRWIYGLAG